MLAIMKLQKDFVVQMAKVILKEKKKKIEASKNVCFLLSKYLHEVWADHCPPSVRPWYTLLMIYKKTRDTTMMFFPSSCYFNLFLMLMNILVLVFILRKVSNKQWREKSWWTSEPWPGLDGRARGSELNTAAPLSGSGKITQLTAVIFCCKFFFFLWHRRV